MGRDEREEEVAEVEEDEAEWRREVESSEESVIAARELDEEDLPGVVEFRTGCMADREVRETGRDWMGVK